MSTPPPDYQCSDDHPPDISSDKPLGLGRTGQPYRLTENGLRNLPGYGATQRKPLKEISPAFA